VRHAWKMVATIGVIATAAALACGGSVSVGGAVGGGGVSVGAGGASGGGAGMAMSSDEHRRDVDEWYRKRIERLEKEDGWLTLVGLFPLPEGRHTFGSAGDNECVFPKSAPAHAGAIVVENGTVRLEGEPGAGLTMDGTPVDKVALATDKDGADPTLITVGTIRFYAIDRPGSLYLRVKDSASPVRKEFKGIDRFKVTRAWRVPAHLDRYDPPKKMTVPNVLGFDEISECPGVLTFKIDHKEYRLEPMSQEGDELWIVYGDATNGNDTYGGGRFVYIPDADADGNTVIDFNKSYNPPCVFTPYATCPLPTRTNVLPMRVEAGEKMWGEQHH
jgi:uncharacterized protein (DUF1684 family)